MKIGVGIVTFNRHSYFKQSFYSAIEKLGKVVDVWCVVDDCSDKEVEKYNDIFANIKQCKANPKIFRSSVNRGVAGSKNTLLKYMMEEKCDYMFILEDDIIIKDEKAVTGYINAAEKSGFSHLCFAYHGEMNKEPLYSDDLLEYHQACIGAWCLYTPEMINKVGYFDENFRNAWEHVHLTKQLGDNGFCPPFGLFIDAAGSKDWLEEIPNSIENSSIRPLADWQENIDKGLEYWKKLDGVGLPKL
jgi:GT2 family glycosyltransferase